MKPTKHTGSLNKEQMSLHLILVAKAEAKKRERGIARRQARYSRHASWGRMTETPDCRAAQRRFRQIKRGSLTISNGLAA